VFVSLFLGMNKLDLARSLAKKAHRSQAKAADEVDTLVHRLIKELKLTRDIAKTEAAGLLRGPVPRPSRES
jgi:hypothetical protein